MKVWLTLLIVLSSTGAGFADAPKTSIRPLPRPALTQPPSAALRDQISALALPDLARMAPRHRPEATPPMTPIATPEKPRKGLLGLITPRAKPAQKAVVSLKGSVCGDPSIKGSLLQRITSGANDCGIEDPVSIISVAGARLNPPATLNCQTAVALDKWVEKGLQPAFPSSKVVGLTVLDSYSCRTRNNVPGAKISEHGRGKAIDVAGVAFANGKDLTVGKDFKTLRKAYKAGCGIFGTTLGPGSDGYHEDHMHFDTARQRGGGAYCR